MADPKYLVPWFEQYFQSKRWYDGTFHQENNRTIPSQGPLLNGGMDEDGNKCWAIRMDYEAFLDSNGFGPSNQEAKYQMVKLMAEDMADVVVNGDRASSDPHLKIYNGEKSTGLHLVDFVSNHFVYYKVKQPKKGTMEYNAWTIIKPVFK